VQDGSGFWNVYEAPSGIDLCQWVHQKGRLEWFELRGVLLGIARELRARLEQGESGGRFSVRHVWIDSYGNAKLLDFPIMREGRDEQFTEFSAAQWRSLIHDIAFFGLMGTPRPSTDGEAAVPRVPMPEHARPSVERISGKGEAVASLPALLEELESAARKPARITRLRRSGPILAPLFPPAILVFGIFLSMAILPMMVAGRAPWMNDLLRISEYSRHLNDLERAPEQPDAARKRESIEKLFAYTFVQSQTTSEGRRLVSTMPEPIRQKMEAAARQYPNISEAEAAEARKLIPESPLQSLTLPTVLRGVPVVASATGFVFASFSLVAAIVLGTGALFRMVPAAAICTIVTGRIKSGLARISPDFSSFRREALCR